MEITAAMVKALRDQTGAGVLDCRKALEASGGDFDKAAELLRAKGMASAVKKAERVANEGLIGSYIHTGSKVAALVEVNCESDFVARTPDFQQLARDLAMQVVAAKPLYVRREEVPAEALEEAQGKGGKIEKFYEEVCLMDQPFIKNESVKVQELVTVCIAKLGENITVKRFSRLEVGG